MGTGRSGLDSNKWGRWRPAVVVRSAGSGPHRELSPGPAVAYPSHRLPQEVGAAPNGVGAVIAQPGHQHVPGAGGDG